MERVGKPRIVDGPIQREGLLAAAEAQRLREEAPVILARLEAAGGAWVPMPNLAHDSGAYAVHSRVAELRKRGHRIEQRSDRHGRRVLSYYRLVEGKGHE